MLHPKEIFEFAIYHVLLIFSFHFLLIHKNMYSNMQSTLWMSLWGVLFCFSPGGHTCGNTHFKLGINHGLESVYLIWKYLKKYIWNISENAVGALLSNNVLLEMEIFESSPVILIMVSS